MNIKEKNLLDLQHSFSLSKAVLFFSLGIGSGITIFFGAKEVEIPVFTSFNMALLFSLILIYQSFKNFEQCKSIQEKISSAKVYK